jgi:hypothetical protein
MSKRSARRFTADNRRRANTVRSALQFIARSQYPQANPRLKPLRTKGDFTNAVVDLLADIRHFCEARKIAFDEADHSADRHYIAEVEQARTGEEL